MLDIGGITRPIVSEEVCGDALAGRQTDHSMCSSSPTASVTGRSRPPSQAAVAAFFETEETEPGVCWPTP